MAAEDSNSRLGRFQKIRQVLAKSNIGAVLDGGRLQTNFQSALDYTPDFIFARARLHADQEDNCAFATLQVEHHFAPAEIIDYLYFFERSPKMAVPRRTSV